MSNRLFTYKSMTKMQAHQPKWLYLLAAFVCLFGSLQAQQETKWSQYMFNRLVVNPAYAGTKEYLSVTALYRWQWVGFEGAPRVGSLSGHFAAGRNNQHGIGAFFITDQLGAETKTAFGLNYAFRIRLDNEKPHRRHLSFGLQLAGITHDLDQSKISTRQPNDPVFSSAIQTSFTPDFGAGAFYKSRRFYAGLSVAHLVEFDIKTRANMEDSKLRRHIFGTAGYDIPLTENDDWILTPSTMIRYVNNTHPQADLNVNLMMIQKFWIGAGYRTEDAVMLQAGFYPHRQLRIGYAFDLVTSKINHDGPTSHEIMVSFDFGDPQSRTRVVTPRYF
jgi:type IX secretion system PorP/SprF family membrane protein